MAKRWLPKRRANGPQERPPDDPGGLVRVPGMVPASEYWEMVAHWLDALAEAAGLMQAPPRPRPRERPGRLILAAFAKIAHARTDRRLPDDTETPDAEFVRQVVALLPATRTDQTKTILKYRREVAAGKWILVDPENSED